MGILETSLLSMAIRYFNSLKYLLYFRINFSDRNILMLQMVILEILVKISTLKDYKKPNCILLKYFLDIEILYVHKLKIPTTFYQKNFYKIHDPIKISLVLLKIFLNSSHNNKLKSKFDQLVFLKVIEHLILFTM